MDNRKGLSLVELIFVLVIIMLFLALVGIPFNNVTPIAHRVLCGTNLKSLGTAMIVYANVHDGKYPQLSGTGPWSKELGFDYYLDIPDFKEGSAQHKTARTISASWYLLVKYADVAPKSFVCPASIQQEYDGMNPQKRDIIDLWDFGPEPYKHVSYVMHNPYGQFPADTSRSAAFAIAADMNPYFETGDILTNPKETVLQKKIDSNYPHINQIYNAVLHQTEGQNVLYADGHNSYETRPDVGVKHDNIYTYWRIKTDEKPNELDQRIGQPPTGRSPENDAQDKDDSFLAI